MFQLSYLLICAHLLVGMPKPEANPIGTIIMEENKAQTITLGAGCFWCIEALFEELKGVDKVVSGYMGGRVPNPTYREICSGITGHAEVVQVSFDARIISVQEILEVFFQMHDPTTLNRQGADVGTQYRSAVFFHTDEQQTIAENTIAVLNDENVFPNPIVTEVTKASKFYQADNYHQQYYELNGEEAYCRFVIKPKLDKFRKVFKEKIK
jgi:peptide-methionine (S)-S-oxide reductase